MFIENFLSNKLFILTSVLLVKSVISLVIVKG